MKLFGIQENTFGLPDFAGTVPGWCPAWTERHAARTRADRACRARGVAALAGCTASPTVRGYVGQTRPRAALATPARAVPCRVPGAGAVGGQGPSAGCGKPAGQALGQYEERAR